MTMKTPTLKAVALATLLAAGGHAVAGEETLDIENRSRAKIAKEKVKQAALERKLEKLEKTENARAADCGSQNIGVIDNSDRPGAAPREVFVFAPNAINLVTGNGCR
jgi:hypothetical protein